MSGLGTVILAGLGLAALGAVVGLAVFRETSQKMVVLDVLTTVMAAALVVFALVFDSSFLLDIALVYAVLSFAAVLVVARYLERGL